MWNISMKHIYNNNNNNNNNKIVMKQSKGLKGDLKPEHKKPQNGITMSPTTYIKCQAPTVWKTIEE